MKKSLSLVVALAMVFSLLTPAMAFAATSEEAAAGAFLEELGVLKGDGEGELYLDNNLNRQDMIVLLSRLMGVEDEVEEYGNTHGWEDVTDPYYDSYISWAKEEGLTIGVGDGSEFGYNEELSVQELLTFLIRALGYEGDWYDVPEQAVELGLIDEDADLSAVATRGIMAVATQKTLNTPVNGSDETLGVQLGLLEPEVDVAETQAEAINLIQIEVLLEDGFNAEEAEEVKNYELDDLEVIDVDLDGNVAILTLEEAAENQTEDVLTIDKGVTGEELEFEIEFFDVTLPEVTDVAVVGKNTVKVTFTEPINFEADEDGEANPKYEDEFDAEIDGKDYVISHIDVLDHGKEANVVFFGTFKEGTMEFEIGNKVKDYAGYSVRAQTVEVEVVEDDTAPVVVGYKDAKRNKVTLIFDEDIQRESDDVEDFYHTNKKNAVSDIDDVEINGNELTLTFNDDDHYLPDGTAYVYIGAEAISNLWDVENEQQIRVEIYIEEDNEGPVVEEINAEAGEIEIVFNEDLDEESAEDEDNYVILDDDGDKKDVIRRAELDGDTVTLTLKEDLDDGVYTIEIENIKDLFGNKMADYEEEFTLDDGDAPDFPDEILIEKLGSGNDYRLIIDFGESMATEGKYSVLDLEKYTLHYSDKNGNPTSDVLAKIEDKYDVEIDAEDNNEVVEITLEDLPAPLKVSGADGHGLEIGRVADDDDNFTDYSSGKIDFEWASQQEVVISKVKAVAKDVLEVEFDKNLDKFEARDFRVVRTTTSLGTSGQFTLDSDNTTDVVTGEVYEIAKLEIIDSNEIRIELATELDADAKINNVATYLAVLPAGQKTIDDSVAGSESRYGAKLVVGAFASIEDKIAPEVDEEDVTVVFDEDGADNATADGESQITIKFNEVIRTALINETTFSVNGGDNEIVDFDFVTAAFGSKADEAELVTYVIITVEGQVFANDKVELTAPIFDLNNNKYDDVTWKIEKESTGDISYDPTT